MQEIRSLNSPVVTGTCNPNKSRERHHRIFYYICVGFFLLHQKYIHQFVKVGDKLQKASAWFCLD